MKGWLPSIAFTYSGPFPEQGKKGIRLAISGINYAQSIRDDRPLTGHFRQDNDWYQFTAPEVDGNFVHDQRVDLFSLGTTLYMLLCGIPPFRGVGIELTQNKLSGNVVFDVVRPSYTAQALVRSLLQPNPDRRISLKEVMMHEWMSETGDALRSHDLSTTQLIFKDYNVLPPRRYEC